MKSPEGMALVKRLLETSDVMIENFRPGMMAGQGLDYESVSAINERLIYCSLKGFLPGPYERRTALDEVVQMMGGLAFMTGLPGRPMRAGASVNDIMGAMFGVIGIQAALRERERTGRGQEIQAGLFENNAFLMAQAMLAEAITEEPRNPGRRRSGRGRSTICSRPATAHSFSSASSVTASGRISAGPSARRSGSQTKGSRPTLTDRPRGHGSCRLLRDHPLAATRPVACHFGKAGTALCPGPAAGRAR